MPDGQNLDKDSEFWQLVAKYRRESREGMLEIFEGTARNSNDVADVLGISSGAALNYLKEAEREGLVECVTPEAKKYKMYVLTAKGEDILDEL